MKIAKELMKKLDRLVGRASRSDAVTLITSAEFAKLQNGTSEKSSQESKKFKEDGPYK